MKTHKKMHALLEQQARARETLESELEIRSALAELDLPEPHIVHICPIRGESGSICFGDRYRPQTIWDDFVPIAEKLPALDMVAVRDGCLSYQTRDHVDSLPASEKQGWQSEVDIAPVSIRVDAGPCPHASMQWRTRLANRIVRIDCNVSIHPVFRVLSRRHEYRGGFRYTDKNIGIPESLKFPQVDDETLGEITVNRFWSPDDSPGTWTLTWTHYRSDRRIEPVHIARIAGMEG